MLGIKSYRQFVYLFLGVIITLVAYYILVNSDYIDPLKDWILANQTAFFIILATIKFLGIVWPPIPGGLITIASVPLIGWQMAYVTDFIGSILGNTVAFYLGRQYGYKFLESIFSDEILQRMEKIRTFKNREIEATIVLGVLGGTVMELISYASGYFKMEYRNFIVGRIISHAIVGIPSYLFVDSIFNNGNYLFNLIFIIIALLIVWKLRTRYFQVIAE